jgi:predicted molibdopterin-dependent oxidoreductase YjgC
VNLEGRLQRLRQAATPPGPNELEWISKLAARFGVDIPPHAPSVFAELSERCYGGLSFGEVGERAPLRGYTEAPAHVEVPPVPAEEPAAQGLQLVSYRPLFSGPAVERVPELQFQRPAAEVTLARAYARTNGIANGDLVTISSNGTSLQLRAKLSNELRDNVALVAEEHSQGLSGSISLALSPRNEAEAP